MAESIDSIIKKFKISNDNLPQNLKGIDENIYKNNLQTIIKKKTDDLHSHSVQSTTISPPVQTITPSQPVQSLTILDMLINFIGIYIVKVKPGSRSLDSISLDEIKKLLF